MSESMKFKTNEASIGFGKKLAGIDKKGRDAGFKALVRWISNHKDLDLLEMNKVWKGLFYSMWLSDKPLVQKDLAEQMSNMIHALDDERAILYIRAFYQTMEVEWVNIDRLRLDKYYMLMRFIFAQALTYIHQRNWEESILTGFLQTLTEGPLRIGEGQKGIKFHLIDIFLEELQKIVGNEEFEQFEQVIVPFYHLISQENDKHIVNRIIKHVFSALLTRWRQQEEDDEEEGEQEEQRYLTVSLEDISQHLFELASSADIKEHNRDVLYNIRQSYKEAGFGNQVPTFETIEEAPQQIEKTKTKKGKKNTNNGHSNGVSIDEEEDESTMKTVQKKTKSQKKTKKRSNEKMDTEDTDDRITKKKKRSKKEKK
eukprot:TRINITY_DN4686_c0_g1_i1.p1 TRINITY_DN4686_c0_g1~~TRINITY_DN4686_c0_g1_i1.p1  ORF type:complete len:370 (+),score=120.26 TRINITY_DN4686_c0_g1_i1:60-1169(+)